MKRILLFSLLSILTFGARAAVLYSQPPSAAGGTIFSSWVAEEGSDSDIYSYDSFTLASNQAITEVAWRGGYAYGGQYGLITNFTITFYDTNMTGNEPLVNNPQLPEFYLAHYNIGGLADPVAAGTFGGVAMYDYHYALPVPFQAEGGHKYWIRIEAWQIGYPDWSIAVGTGGNSSHFQFSTGAARFSFGQGDEAFTLYGADGPSYTIDAIAEPPEGGTIAGAGVYPAGSDANVTATANPGFGFVNWTENGNPVSNSASYTFTANADRTLVAHFVPAYTITTASNPPFAGATTGGGIYNSGSGVALTAVSIPGYVFVNWTWFGSEVSTSANYNFNAAADLDLVANFAITDHSATFDFDTGIPDLFTGEGIPLDQGSNGVTVHVGSPDGSAFSIQTDSSTQWHMSQFSGHYIYPNNQNRNTLRLEFSQDLNGISLTFATTDNHQTEIPTNILLTAYKDSVLNPAVGTASTHGTYATDTFPMGRIAFDSAGAPFNIVDLILPYQPLGATAFFVDNITVTTIDPVAGYTPSPTPTETPIPTETPTVTPSPTPGAINRAAADFDGTGCTDLGDFLILLDYWQVVYPAMGGDAVGLNDFLALLDNWQLGPSC